VKIYVKYDNGKRIFIIAPIWLVKAGLSIGSVFIRYVPEQQRPYVEKIDFRELKKALIF
jgi:hypothetical protein